MCCGGFRKLFQGAHGVIIQENPHDWCRSSSFSNSSKIAVAHSPASDDSVLFLGAIAARRTSPTICMDHALLLSAGATFDRVHGMAYVGFRSHDEGGDYTCISWETTDPQ